MSEWNKQTYIDQEAERMYRTRKLQYTLIIVLLLSWVILAPIIIMMDDKRINEKFDPLYYDIKTLEDNYNVPEVALAKLDVIRVSIIDLGLEPSDNAAYFGNASTRYVKYFLDFLDELEISYEELIIWRTEAFSRTFNVDIYYEYEQRLEYIGDKIEAFTAHTVHTRLSDLVYGAYLNKTLGPISLFNFRLFFLYLPYLFLVVLVFYKIKDDKLPFLSEHCLIRARKKYNIRED